MVYSHTSYSITDLAQHISTDNGLHLYTYNSEGLRIGKQFRDVANDSMTVNTRYIYGAYGELIAQYDGLTLQYWNISGPGGESVGRKRQLLPVGIGDVLQMQAGTYVGYMRYYYLKDHLGSVRVTLRQNGSVVGHDDYYPFGLQMPGRSNNSANRDDDQKFTGHFFEQEGDLGIYHAQARMYDPAIGRFLGVDAMRGEYPSLSSYVYVANNPLRYVDPDGNHIVVTQNDDDTYTVVDGVLNDDTSIFIQGSGEGEMEVLGNMMTTHSFFDENGDVVRGAVIDMNSTEGQDFLDGIISDNPFFSYLKEGQPGGNYDFKNIGLRESGLSADQYHYRGSVGEGGLVGSARDFGNMAAGYAMGSHNVPWPIAEMAFNLQEFKQSGSFAEASVSRIAQRKGYNMGARKATTSLPRVPVNVGSIRR